MSALLHIIFDRRRLHRLRVPRHRGKTATEAEAAREASAIGSCVRSSTTLVPPDGDRRCGVVTDAVITPFPPSDANGIACTSETERVRRISRPPARRSSILWESLIASWRDGLNNSGVISRSALADPARSHPSRHVEVDRGPACY